MFCTKCGNKLSDDSKFCNSCGNNVKPVIKMGKITFKRIGRYVGCLVGISIYVDGKFMGSVQNNGELTVNVPVGKHKVVFSIWSGTNDEEIEVTADKPNVYADIKLKMGALVNRTEIVNIRREE